MAPKPQDRYSSPRDLATDVENWLGDEPVSCYHDTIAERTTRWSRKHRTFVTSSVAILFLLVIGSIVGMIQMNQANQQIRRERNVARENSAKALNNLARSHVSARKPKLGVAVFEQSIAVWRQLLVEENSELDQDRLRESLADSLAELANAQRLTKDADKAIVTLDEALQIKKDLWTKDKSSLPRIVGLAKAYIQVGDVRKGLADRLDERIQWYGEAVKLVETLDIDKQIEADVRDTVIDAFESRAVAYGVKKEHDAAIKDWQRILPMVSNSRKRRGMVVEYAMRLIQVGQVDDGIHQVKTMLKDRFADGTEKLAASVVVAAACEAISSGNRANVSLDECGKLALRLVEQAMTEEALVKGPPSQNVYMLKFALIDPTFKVLMSVPGLKKLLERLEKIKK